MQSGHVYGRAAGQCWQAVVRNEEMPVEAADGQTQDARRRESAWVRYGTAVAAVGAAIAVRLIGWPVLHTDIPWILFALPIMVSAWRGGLGPGLLATLLSALAVDYLLLEPYGVIGIAGTSQAIGYGVFAATGVLISVLADRARVAHARLAETTAELEAANRAVRERGDRLRATFDSAGVGIVEAEGEDDRLVAANDRALEIVGYRREELLGMRVAELTYPDDQALSARMNARLHDGSRDRVNYEKRYRKRDGSPVWVHVTLSAVRDESGRWLRTITTVEDITERKRAEDEVRRLNAELEERVAARTAELRQRAGELEAANRELEAFSYSVSHDLRTPLRSIDGFSKLLLEDYSDVVDETGKEYLNRVRAAAQRMGRLIDDILLLSRATRVEMRRGPVNLSAIAQEAAAELRQSDPHRQVDLEIEAGMAVEGDAELLRIVLKNLLDNAWKFTRDRAPAQIAFGSETVNDERVYCVRDNGAGFDMAYAGKLFGAFQRLHSESEFPGTGIGLALVQRIIRRHGGRVWAHGEVGRGARFCFTVEENR